MANENHQNQKNPIFLVEKPTFPTEKLSFSEKPSFSDEIVTVSEKPGSSPRSFNDMELLGEFSREPSLEDSGRPSFPGKRVVPKRSDPLKINAKLYDG